MELEKDRFDDEFINLEVERIKILFQKNNYNINQQKWFLESKIMTARENNDLNYLKVCEILLNEIDGEKK